MRLYVTGRTPTCVRALANLQHACAHWLPGQYHIEVIDLMENPRRAAEDQRVGYVHQSGRPRLPWNYVNADAQRAARGSPCQ